MSPEELIEAALKSPLDAICVTEHSSLEGAEVALEIGRRMNFPVFRGIEARTDLGDMLVFGWYEDIPDGFPLDELCPMILSSGGAIFAAHPYHLRGGWNLYSALRLEGFDLDADWDRIEILKKLTGIEVVNGNVASETNERARALAFKLGINGIGGSDAHSTSMVGKAATRFKGEITSEADLIRLLRHGAYEAVRLRY